MSRGNSASSLCKQLYINLWDVLFGWVPIWIWIMKSLHIIDNFYGLEPKHVTRASVRAPRQSNSMYIHMVRHCIYKTRRLKHSHSSTCRYKRLTQEPVSQHHYMECFPFHIHSTSTSTTTSTSPCISAAVMITTSTAPLHQESVHRCIRYQMLAPSSASEVLYWYLLPTVFDSHLTYLFFLWVTKLESHLSQASGSLTFARVSFKKFPTLKLWNIPQF